MAKYVMLVNWTDKGIAQATGTIERSERVKQMTEQLGGSTDLLLWTLGRYDIVAVFDLPDDEAAAALGLQLGGLGTVRSETLRAFTAEELGPILQRGA
jgi:uncharacterized protein with GYD domain